MPYDNAPDLMLVRLGVGKRQKVTQAFESQQIKLGRFMPRTRRGRPAQAGQDPSRRSLGLITT